jgi:flavin reductase (DIM6/NTAB) family NADH-FMN oxidoreductase RutF
MAKPRTPLSQIPYGLYVVGSTGESGTHAMTANWLTQVSFEPEIVALAVERGSFTRKLIEERGAFTVSILKAGQKDVAEHFIKRHPEGEDKFAGYPVFTRETGAPILENCSAYLECRVVDSVPAGDHIVYFGEVVDRAMLDPQAEALTLRETGWRYGG